MKKAKFIDLSHTIEDGLVTYKGLPPPVISDFLSRERSHERYAPGTEFQIGRIEMIANTGTYIDSPFHRYADGADLAALELESLSDLEGIVVRHIGAGEGDLEVAAVKARAVKEMEAYREMASAADAPAADGHFNMTEMIILTRGQRGITVADMANVNIRGKAVLFHTGWDLRWRTEEYANGQHPFVTEEAAEYLAVQGAALVGIDSLNIDDTATGERPAHSILLGHNIPIVEHLCGLRELPQQGFRFFAVPPKVRGFGSFPVRAFAIVESE
jgi:kynurenine formamidase